MVASLSCGYCASNNIQLKETFNFFLSGFCKNCNDNIFSASTSESEKGASSSSKPSSSFINRRLVAASRNSGIGFNKLVHFFADMDMPQPLHLISWQAIDRLFTESQLRLQRNTWSMWQKYMDGYSHPIGLWICGRHSCLF